MEHMKQVDWDKIKIEYLNEGTSMRSLSKKYGIPHSTISFRCKKEGWKKTEEQIAREAMEKTVQKAVAYRVSNNERAMVILTDLLAKMEEAVKSCNKKDVGAMKSLVAGMKDLRDMGVFQVVNDTTEADIKVDMGGTEDYAQ